MITTKPKPLRFQKKRPTTLPTPPLTLVAAVYEVGSHVELTFDRAVDASAMDAASVIVNDGDVANFVYGGVDASQTDGPRVVRVSLNGIVAAGDGAAWAGVTALALPFGS